jgi:hypothetical protein
MRPGTSDTRGGRAGASVVDRSRLDQRLAEAGARNPGSISVSASTLFVASQQAAAPVRSG